MDLDSDNHDHSSGDSDNYHPPGDNDSHGAYCVTIGGKYLEYDSPSQHPASGTGTWHGDRNGNGDWRDDSKSKSAAAAKHQSIASRLMVDNIN